MIAALPMTIFDQISIRIIKEQEQIIGPLAWDEASKVPGLSVDPSHTTVTVSPNDPKVVINALVSQYELLFGKLSHEISKGVVQDLVAELSKDEVPESLQ